MGILELPSAQRKEYNHLLEQLYAMTQQIEHQLPMYCIVLRSRDLLCKFLLIVSSLSRLSEVCRVKPFIILDITGGASKGAVFNRLTPVHNWSWHAKEYVFAVTKGHPGI